MKRITKTLLVCGSALMAISVFNTVSATPTTNASNQRTVKQINRNKNQKVLKPINTARNNKKKSNKDNKKINLKKNNKKKINLRENKNRKIKKTHLKHQSKKYHSNVSNKWTLNNGFNHKLNGKFLVCTKPSIKKGSTAIASKKDIKGMRVSAYRSKTYDHVQTYDKVSNRDGQIIGWVNSNGLTSSQNIPKGTYTPSDTHTYQRMRNNIIKADYNLELAKDSRGSNAKSKRSLAKNYINSAKSDIKNLDNKKLRNLGKNSLKRLSEAYYNLNSYNARIYMTHTLKLSNKITNNVKQAQKYFEKAQNNSSKSSSYKNMAYDLLSEAQANNEQLTDTTAKQENSALINAMYSYKNSLNNHLSSKTQQNINKKYLNIIKHFSNLAKLDVARSSHYTQSGKYDVAMAYAYQANSYVKNANTVYNLMNNSSAKRTANNVINNIQNIYQ